MLLKSIKRYIKRTPLGQWILQVMRYDHRIDAVEQKILEMRMELIKFHSPNFESEVNYILNNGYAQYPYKRICDLEPFESGFDNIENLPFVVHKGKRLYFPNSESVEWCRQYYITCVRDEAILGGQYLEKHPHQYQSKRCKIEEGDILIDVGCAEALMVLDNIDIISKAYMFECDSRWFAPLKTTFKNYLDKVNIIYKYVGDKDTEETITLNTALKDEVGSSVFIKMDIEGAEVSVLAGNRKFLESNKQVKLAVCTYHRQDDAEAILTLFEEMGYQHEFSDGYMYLGNFDKYDKFPYFRKGVLRGWK